VQARRLSGAGARQPALRFVDLHCGNVGAIGPCGARVLVAPSLPAQSAMAPGSTEIAVAAASLTGWMGRTEMKWKTQYATGIHNIDRQHRTLVEIITQYERINDDDARPHELYSLIARTLKFMQFHFLVEESLMRLLPYPECDAHRDEHQRELGYIVQIGRRLLRQGESRVLIPLVRDCLFHHIVADDRRFAHYALRLFGAH
jgi:hemerythrin